MKTVVKVITLVVLVSLVAGCGGAADKPADTGQLTAAEQWAQANGVGPYQPEVDDWAAIEAAAIKEFQGESVYRFILNKRIRELHVKEDIRQQLVAGSLIITSSVRVWRKLIRSILSCGVRKSPDSLVFSTVGSTVEEFLMPWL